MAGNMFSRLQNPENEHSGTLNTNIHTWRFHQNFDLGRVFDVPSIKSPWQNSHLSRVHTLHHDKYLPNTAIVSYIVWLVKLNNIQISRFQITKMAEIKDTETIMENRWILLKFRLGMFVPLHICFNHHSKMTPWVCHTLNQN